MSWKVIRLRVEPTIGLSIGSVDKTPSNFLLLDAGGGRGREETKPQIKSNKVCERGCVTYPPSRGKLILETEPWMTGFSSEPCFLFITIKIGCDDSFLL